MTVILVGSGAPSGVLQNAGALEAKVEAEEDSDTSPPCQPWQGLDRDTNHKVDWWFWFTGASSRKATQQCFLSPMSLNLLLWSPMHFLLRWQQKWSHRSQFCESSRRNLTTSSSNLCITCLTAKKNLPRMPCGTWTPKKTTMTFVGEGCEWVEQSPAPTMHCNSMTKHAPSW